MTRPLTPDTLVYDVEAAVDPRISPDGERIAYTLSTTDRATKKGGTQLWLCNRDGSNRRRLTWSGENNGGARWSPDGGMLAFMSDRGGEEKGGGIYVLPVTGGEAREVTSHRVPISEYAWSPDGTKIAYLALFDPENPDEEPPDPKAAPKVRATSRKQYKQDGRGWVGDVRSQLWVVDVQSGERKRLTGYGDDLPRDHMLAQWSPDGRTIGVLRRVGDDVNVRLILIDVESGDEQVIDFAWGHAGYWSWSPDGTRIIFAGDPDKSSQQDFYLLDVPTKEVRQVTDDLPILIGSLAWGLGGPELPVWLDERQVLFLGARAGANGLYAVDSEGGSVEPVHTWQAAIGGLSVDAAKRFVVSSIESFEEHGNIVVYDMQTGTESTITDYNADVYNAERLPTWERFEVQRGKYAIEAWLLKPPGFDETKQYPFVLDIHGGPQGAFGYSFSPWDLVLATHGFLVAKANPRGSVTYGREFTTQVLGDWGGEDYLDLIAVVDKVLERPYADATRTGILGYSYGGYMTSWMLGQTDRFQACVCGSPPFDLEAMFGTSDIAGLETNQWGGGTPWTMPEQFQGRSPSTYAHRCTTPTLIIEGEADERCPIGQAEAMFTILKTVGCEAELVRYPGGAHIFLINGPAEHRVDMYGRILGWFQKHIGDNAGETATEG